MTELSAEHRAYLNAHAVSDTTITDQGIYSEGDEIVFPWTDGGRRTLQRRPWPGESGVYVWEKDVDLHFWNLRDAGPDTPIVLIEGTKQSLAAATYAPDGYTVLGMAGCWGWSKEKLGRFKGREVFLCLDADAASNLDVYEAGERLGEKLKRYGVALKYLRIPAGSKDGLDDYLASFDEDERADMLAYEIAHAATKPADKKPTARKRKIKDGDIPDLGDRVGVAINLDRKEVVDKITNALKDRHDGRDLFNYGDVLTRVQGHETQPLDRDRFYDLLINACACFKYSEATDKRPEIFEPAWPDAPSMSAVMSRAEQFSTLKRVVRVPFLRPDGTIRTQPGYDESTHTILVSSGLTELSVPEEPSQEETRAAAKFLMQEWLGDLPFKGPADTANALGLLLTPFIRGLVPLAPLGVVNGLEAGVGKNLFADCVAILTTGEAAVPLPYVNNDEEMRKQLTSAFAGGRELFVFDEAHVIEGPQFARAVTSVTYGDRILGVSRIAQFPNQVTWMSLGNQVQVNGDMSRRVYFVYLHPSGTTLSDRESREYRHEDLKAWTGEHREELVSAALTVLRGWVAAGRPQYSRGATMGSFEPWDRMLSGVLAYAGYPEFLTDMRERRSESDFANSYWEAHIHWLHQVFGSAEFTTGQVREAAQRDPSGFEAPPGMEDTSGRDYTRRLGMGYSRHKDRTYNGVRLIKAGLGHKSTIRWQTVRSNGGTEVEGGSPLTPPVTGERLSDVNAHAHVPRVEGGGETTSICLPTSSGPSSSVVVGFDIETASADQMFMGGHEGPFVRLSGLIEDAQPDGVTGPSAEALVDSLNNADVIYGHNVLKFDLVALARHHGADYDVLAAKAIDTYTLSQLIDPPGAKGMKPWGAAGYYGLDQVAQRLGHEGKSDDLKALAAEFGGYDKIPTDDPRYVAYLRGDLAATRHVYESLCGQPLSDYAEREMRVAAIQNRMTLNGWKIDTELLAQRVKQEDDRREAAVAALRDEFGMPTEKVTYKLKAKKDWSPDRDPFTTVADARELTKRSPAEAVNLGYAVEKREPYASPWSTAEGRDALVRSFQDAGAPHYPQTKTGALALSSDALGPGFWVDHTGQRRPGMQRAYGHLPGVVRLCELIGQATGATAKYAEIARWTTAEGRVHPETSAVQASGRWATNHPANGNLGARGEKVEERRVYVADEGHVLLTCDAAQVDVRAVAAHSQDPALIEMLQPGKDYHTEMAKVFFGDPSRRNEGKPISHSMNYNQSAKACAERNGLDLEFVQEAFRMQAERMPRLQEWKQEVIELGMSGALLDNGFGRLMRCDPERAYTQAPALMGQGAARDIVTESLLRLVAYAQDKGLEVRPHLRGVVHDEVILSVPEDEAEVWMQILNEAFTWEWKGVPILCAVSNPGKSWADCAH